VFKLDVTATPSHPTYRAGLTSAAVCLVDSDDVAEATGLAIEKLSALHWKSPVFETTIVLPKDPDISTWSSTLAQAYSDAMRLGVCLVVYPESEH
jgi:hypothetical protein